MNRIEMHRLLKELGTVGLHGLLFEVSEECERHVNTVQEIIAFYNQDKYMEDSND